MTHCPISIVIRTLNSAQTLERVLDALHADASDQLIVVDSGSTDTTLEIAARHQARVIPIQADSFTYGRALNLGFAAAENPWILSLSSHTIPAIPKFLDHYRDATLRFHPHVTAAVGPILTMDSESPLPGGITTYELADFTHGWGFGAGNPNCLYRRTAWLGRPFNEDSPGGEDLEWYLQALRAGETLAAVHPAAVRYVSRQSVRAFYRKGRVDHRAAARLIQPHNPTLAGIFIRIAKMALYTVMGKADWHSVRGSIAHCLGTYVEARSLQHEKSSSHPRPEPPPHP